MDILKEKEILAHFLASNIHESWRKTQLINSNPKKYAYKPSWKETKDVRFIYNIISKKKIPHPYTNAIVISTNSLSVDIANLEYLDLPYDLRYSNLFIARLCINLLFDKVITSQIISDSELNNYSSLLYLKCDTPEKASAIISADEIENIKKDYYKGILKMSIQIIKDYSKEIINLDGLYSLGYGQVNYSSSLNIIDASKFLKIDTATINPILNIEDSSVSKQDLFWNTDIYTGTLSYLNINSIKNIWFIESFYKYIDKFADENAKELFDTLSEKVGNFEDTPKWLVKAPKDNMFSGVVKFIKTTFFEKRILAKINEYEYNKNFALFLSMYLNYSNRIKDIKSRYITFNKTGLCTIEFKNEDTSVSDYLTIYEDGNIAYITSDFWDKPNLVLDTNIGDKLCKNIVAFFDDVSCKNLTNTAINCSLRMESTSILSKINAIKDIA